MRIAIIAIAAFIFVQACNRKNDYQSVFNNPILYCQTVHELNGVVMGNNFSPIVASRNYLYASIAAYEVIAAGYPARYESLGNQLHGLGNLPKPPAGQGIDFPFAATLAYCKLGEAVTFPAGSMQEYTDSLKQLAKDHGMPDDVFNNSIAYCDTVSAVILAWSKQDNYAQTRSFPKYTVIDTPGRWVPTDRRA